MMICWFRFAFASWVLLKSKTNGQSKPTIKYRIYNGLGEESSFLYANGRIRIECIAHSAKPQAEVILKAGVVNSIEPKDLAQANGTVSLNVSLDVFEYSKLFCYSTGYGSEELMITYRMCNPMLLKPPITTCQDKEVCLQSAAKTFACKNINELVCEMNTGVFENNLPFSKFACIDDLPPDLKEGFCKAMQTKKGPFSGMTTDRTACIYYHTFKLDGNIVSQESILLKSIGNGNLKAEFVQIASVFKEAVCEMISSKKEKIHLAKGFPSNITSINKEPSLILPIDLVGSTASLSLPMKFVLTCSVINSGNIMKSTSAYLLLFDDKQFNLSIKKTHIEKDLYSLTCSAKPMEGIEFTVSWDKEPTSYDERSSANKSVTNAFDDVKQTHKCYCVGYAYQYPYKAGLKKLPTPALQRSIEIDRAKVILTNDKKHGNETKTDDKSENKNKDENKAGASDLGVVIGVVLGIFALFAIVGILGFVGFRKFRKRLNEKFLRICRQDKKHIVRGFDLEELTNDVIQILSQSYLDNTEVAQSFNTNPKLKRYKDEFEELESVKPPDANMGYLSTTRFPAEPILRPTWANEDNPDCHLEDRKPKKMDPTKPVKGLHMNSVTDCNYKDTYLASSAPMPHEFSKFYETVFEKNVSMIVCLTSDSTEIDEKTVTVPEMEPYWDCEKKKTFGGYSVITKFLKDDDCNEIRNIEITKKSTLKTVEVRHILFKNVKIFEHSTKFYDFTNPYNYHKLMLSEISPSANSLVLVSCLNGIDKTGVFIAVALGIQFLEKYGLPLNYFQIVKKLQSERANALSSLVHYIHALFGIATQCNSKLQLRDTVALPIKFPKQETPPIKKSILKKQKHIQFNSKVESVGISTVDNLAMSKVDKEVSGHSKSKSKSPNQKQRSKSSGSSWI